MFLLSRTKFTRTHVEYAQHITSRQELLNCLVRLVRLLNISQRGPASSAGMVHRLIRLDDIKLYTRTKTTLQADIDTGGDITVQREDGTLGHTHQTVSVLSPTLFQ
jgi:hypothetical protein